MRAKIDFSKISGMGTYNSDLDARYGMPGTDSRAEFDSKAKAWYYAEILKDARKRAGITQQELADKVGKKRAYISLIERGETDMQLSTFLQISAALGLRFSLVYG